MRRLGVSSLLTLALLILAVPAFAGPGIHAGMSLDPDDFLIGLHFKSRPMAENLTLVPSIEAGFGDITWVAGNLDLHYDLPTDSNFDPYLGAGITLNWFDFEPEGETEFGGSILGGITLNERFFFEAKAGLGDVPDWKFYVGAHR
jgi:hypothetical protein